MENEPLNSIEIEFTQMFKNEGVSKIRQAKKEVKVFFTRGSELMDLIFKDLSSGVHLRSLTPSSMNQSIRFQFNIHTELDSLEPEM